MRRLIGVLSSLTIALGVSLLVVAGAVYAYSAYERLRFDQSLTTQPPPDMVGTPVLMDTSDSMVATEEQAAAEAVAEATPTPEEPMRMPPARWIRIPKIGVDSPVVESPVENGEWQVPKFVVGHLEGTANPGEVGNAAFSGHVESISSGNVFARLKELAVGDDVDLLTDAKLFRYRVAEVKIVRNDDLSVLRPMPEPVITLITCAGTWNPLTRDYSQRLIVLSRPVN